MSHPVRKFRIAHLTSVHPRHDTRVFIKQCRSLANHGYAVTLIVADGKGDADEDGVSIVDVGKPAGRRQRIFGTTRRVFAQAIALDADLYHLHDPELLPAGLQLKKLGKKVIFDSHEDVPRQILGKPYIPSAARGLLSVAFDRYEHHACARLDGIIAATPFIRDKFLRMHPRVVDINNFPILGELETDQAWLNKPQEVCYIGGLGRIRGIMELVHACESLHTPARVNLAGRFSEPEVEKAAKARTGWQRINELGFLDRAGIRKTLARSVAGLVTLHPVINYLDALPVKMFEYMAAGIAVIASDFPLWREIVDGSECGLCVDPLDPMAIAGAIDYLVTNPDVAYRMGQNGRYAVATRYNWSIEERKLFDFYAAIVGEG